MVGALRQHLVQVLVEREPMMLVEAPQLCLQ